MSHHNDPGESSLTGHGLPGTGGDLSPTDVDQDVEGHRRMSGSGVADDGVGPDGMRRLPATDPSADGDDTEGHLFRTGPTTEGEFTRRGPGENPHGDR